MQGEYELLQTPLQSVVCIRTPLCTFYDTAKQLITEFQVNVWELSPLCIWGENYFYFYNTEWLCWTRPIWSWWRRCRERKEGCTTHLFWGIDHILKCVAYIFWGGQRFIAKVVNVEVLCTHNSQGSRETSLIWHLLSRNLSDKGIRSPRSLTVVQCLGWWIAFCLSACTVLGIFRYMYLVQDNKYWRLE